MQLTDLHHEHQYFIDSAIELGDISAMTHDVIMLYGDRASIERIIDAEQRHGATHRGRLRHTCLCLDGYALRLALEQPVEMQRALKASAIIYAHHQIIDAANALARWRSTDFATAYRLRKNCEPSLSAMKSIIGRDSIRRYVKRDTKIAPHMAAVAARWLALPWPSDLSEASLVQVRLDERFRIIRERNARAIEEIQKGLPQKRSRGAPRREHMLAQRRTVKAAALAAAVVGAQAVYSFARGEPVEVRGEKMILEISRGMSSLMDKAGSCNLAIKALDGVRLGKVCCYFEGTPPLDQLAAFALNMAAGEEEAILKAGNLYSVTDAGAAHPLFVGIRVPQNINNIAGISQRAQAHRRLLKAHFEMCGNLYIEALAVRVMGARDAKHVGRLLARRELHNAY